MAPATDVHQTYRGPHACGRADRLVDRPSGTPFYVVNIEADSKSLQRAGDLKLLAGMPAEVYITGAERTPLQYLMEPLLQVVRRAGRER